MNQVDAIHPWDRRPKETPKSFAMFGAYRDLGPTRSLRDLDAREPATNLRQLAYWSKAHDWVDRTAAWDEHVDRENQFFQLEAAAQMRREHTELGHKLVEAAMERVRTINIEKLSVREVCMLADLGVKIERQARGEATAKIDVNPTPEAPEGPTGADILAALRNNPEVLELAEALDRVMFAKITETES